MQDKPTDKFIRFKDKNGAGCWGRVLPDDTVLKLHGDLYSSKVVVGEEKYDVHNVKILPPCEPSKIIAIGLNYKDHAKELGMPVPDEPVIFLKPASALAAHNEKIAMPSSSNQIDYEAELAVIIGKTAKNISTEEASQYIFGYTCANDVTARDLQKKDVQWSRAKGFDGFCPAGPFIIREKPVESSTIRLFLNGEVKQHSALGQMIFSVEEIVSFISKVMTLNPGDLILTGTPPGVGKIENKDIVEVDIETIGILKNVFECEKNLT